MARFGIKVRNIQREVGAWVRRLAARVAAGGLGAAQEEKFDPKSSGKDTPIKRGEGVALTEEFCADLEGGFAFDESVEAAAEQSKRALAASSGKEMTYVQFHFDRTLTTKDGGNEVRVVNVVVPDLSSKLVLKDGKPQVGDDGEPLTDLNGIVEEAFGNIVFSTCQK
ncbi:hypothetical protein [Yoonia sp. 2307UL14-13]|uniref:hypothetical protein n=1 Tax=Yoonia sp. 2307UL14-13 TaxID=3126506 RepID=UPI00309DBA37